MIPTRLEIHSTACRSSMYRMIGCCVSESPGSVQRALAAPLDCISKKGFGSYNLALEAKALMTPTLMVSALCGSCSCNSVLQLLKTVQSNERLIQARLRLHKTQLQYWRKNTYGTLCPSISTVTTYYVLV